MVLSFGAAHMAQAKRKPQLVFAPSPPVAAPQPKPNGSIYQEGHYVPLTSGTRASQVGDILTIMLVERTSSSKSNSASTDRGGDIGLTPPVTGILSAIKPTDVKISGKQSFKGKGETAQSNQLSGEVSVTVAAVYPNGTMFIRGEKLMTLNRGDEAVQISGLVRASDISNDNRILSTRVADARINYVGKGEIARASQQGWLQRFFSKISPF
jgi:flagellar L-ring protein FlgH